MLSYAHGPRLRSGDLTTETIPQCIRTTESQDLNLSNNKIRVLERWIGNLTQLDGLNFDNNMLESLPSEIRYLIKLQELRVANNKLVSLPKEIAYLIELRGLHFRKNQLKSVPGEIGHMRKLEALDLSDNQLRWLPASVRKLKKLEDLNICKNPDFMEYGDLDEIPKWQELRDIFGEDRGKIFGWQELRDIFGDSVIYFDQDAVRDPSGDEIYKALAAKSLCWDVERFRRMRLDPVPKHKLSHRKIAGIWKNKLSQHMPEQISAGRVTAYIEGIYCPTNGVTIGWGIQPEHIKDLLEAIFLKIEEQITQKRSVVASLYDIGEAADLPPYGQRMALSMIYFALYQKNDTEGSFKDFIKNQIIDLKERVFRTAATLGKGDRNIPSYARYNLRNRLGLDIQYKRKTSVFDENPLRNSDCDVLEAFCVKFTPEYVIGELVKEINIRPIRRNEAHEFLAKKHVRCCGRFKFTYRDSAESPCLLCTITESDVESILIRMKVLFRNNNMGDEDSF